MIYSIDTSVQIQFKIFAELTKFLADFEAIFPHQDNKFILVVYPNCQTQLE